MRLSRPNIIALTALILIAHLLSFSPSFSRSAVWVLRAIPFFLGLVGWLYVSKVARLEAMNFSLSRDQISPKEAMLGSLQLLFLALFLASFFLLPPIEPHLSAALFNP